jgi:hypothetical protein
VFDVYVLGISAFNQLNKFEYEDSSS